VSPALAALAQAWMVVKFPVPSCLTAYVAACANMGQSRKQRAESRDKDALMNKGKTLFLLSAL
jgi:hypothetical protein